MKILIWARFSSHHFAIKNVITNICNRISVDEKNEYTILTNKENISEFTKNEKINIIPVGINRDNAILNHFFTVFILPVYVLLKKYDLVIFPQITFYLFKTSKLLFYIHDLIEFKLDNQTNISLFFRKYFFKRIAKISDHIITVSENSKVDIIRFLKCSDARVSVLYNGRDENLYPQDKAYSFENLYHEYHELSHIGKYILYVGYLAHPQKNILFAIDGVVDFIKKNDFYFLLVGPDGKDAKLIHKKIDEANKYIGMERIIALGTVNKNLLPFFYSGASCFIFTSLYEGFGMPVIEAMSCSCPVITSNTSSLKEISQGYAMLVNPNNLDEFKNALEAVISQPRKDISFYRNHLEKFTWNKHVSDLIHLINDSFGGFHD